jgi:glycosyltransferase involved in cell wall biosynthesis
VKTGIAITTYFREDTAKERFSIFRTSIESLLATEYPGNIFLVDDGSEILDHIRLLGGINGGYRIKMIGRPHGGIARAKNTCIKALLADGVDVGYLADDDMLYKDPVWHTVYSEAVVSTGMAHLCFYHNNKPCELVNIKGHVLRQTPEVNGSFFTITLGLIQKIGYMKILPHDYGHEHSNFSFRADRLYGQGGFFDIVDAKKYIDLVPESLSVRSVSDISEAALSENAQSAIHSEFKYEPFVE